MIRKLSVFLFCLILCSCNGTEAENTKLLLSVEERIFSKDRIIQHQVFKNGLIQAIVSHDSSKPEEVFNTSYSQLDETKLLDLEQKIQELKSLDYHNDFPWKEDFSKRATVYKFTFLKEIQTQAFKSSDSKTVLVPTTYYYYSGLQTEPKIFEVILSAVKNDA